MPQPIRCDMCGEVLAVFLVTNLDSGTAQGLCVGCFAAVGVGLQALADEAQGEAGTLEGAPGDVELNGAVSVATDTDDGAPKSEAEGDTEAEADQVAEQDEVPTTSDG